MVPPTGKDVGSSPHGWQPPRRPRLIPAAKAARGPFLGGSPGRAPGGSFWRPWSGRKSLMSNWRATSREGEWRGPDPDHPHGCPTRRPRASADSSYPTPQQEGSRWHQGWEKGTRTTRPTQRSWRRRDTTCRNYSGSPVLLARTWGICSRPTKLAHPGHADRARQHPEHVQRAGRTLWPGAPAARQGQQPGGVNPSTDWGPSSVCYLERGGPCS